MPALVFSTARQKQAWAEATDLQLLEAMQRSEEPALDELVRRKTGALIQLTYRIIGDFEEARDIVQVTFLRLWEHRAKFDDRWSPNTWIYRIASNLAIDQLRSRRSRERSAEPVRQHLRLVGEGHSDLERISEMEVAGIFRELATELSEKQRLIFLLREVEGMPSSEVARIAGCRESTVRNHIFNARKVLQAALRKRYPEYAPESVPGRREESA